MKKLGLLGPFILLCKIFPAQMNWEMGFFTAVKRGGGEAVNRVAQKNCERVKLFVLLRRRTEPSSQFLSDVGLVDCVSSLTTFLLSSSLSGGETHRQYIRFTLRYCVILIEYFVFYTFLDCIAVSHSLIVYFFESFTLFYLRCGEC